MKRVIMNIYYRFNLALSFLYPIDKIADEILSRSLASGIKKIEHSDHTDCHTGEGYHIIIHYNDGCVAELWNVNKWYAWLSHGVVKFPTGKRYKWDNARPTVKTLFKYKQYMKSLKTTGERIPAFVDDLYYLES